MKEMSKAYQKFVVVTLAMLVAVGSVSVAVAGALTCLPKACCCTMKTPDAMDHQVQDVMVHQGQMQMEAPQNCTPKKPAPCCRVEPFKPKTDLAISSQPSIVPQRMSLVHMVPDYAVKSPQEDSLHTSKTVLDTGPLLKIPIVPIYLQTLSILC